MKIFYVLAVLLFVAVVAGDSGCRVTTKKGKLRGRYAYIGEGGSSGGSQGGSSGSSQGGSSGQSHGGSSGSSSGGSCSSSSGGSSGNSTGGSSGGSSGHGSSGNGSSGNSTGGSSSGSAGSGQQYSCFLGIPYAQPPIGKLRFREPAEVVSWSEELDVTVEKDVCMQRVKDKTVGSEDCLYLDVFTPLVDFEVDLKVAPEKKPVFVWFAGPGMLTGYTLSPQNLQEHFMRENCLFVTIQHRIDLFGYLALEDVEGVKGNAGLKDQVKAMEFIKENIEVFGGDPNNIILLGEGLQSAHVGYHMLISKSAGLFAKAILHNGSPLASWAYQKREDIIKSAFEVGASLGISTSDHNELYERLQSVSAEQLMEKVYSESSLPAPLNNVKFGVTQDGEFLIESAIDSFRNGNINKCSSMIGFNKEEAVLIVAGAEVVGSAVISGLKSFTNVLPGFLEIAIESFLKMLIEQIQNGINVMESAAAFFFAVPVDLTQKYMVKVLEDTPVFFYRLSIDVEKNMEELFNATAKVSGEVSGDISTLYGYAVHVSSDANSALNQWRQKMVSTYCSFGKAASSAGSISLKGGVQWQASGSTGGQLNIGSTISYGERLLSTFYSLLEQAFDLFLSIRFSVSGSASFGIKF